MSTQPTTNDLDNSIGTLETALSKLGSDIKSAIADLEAKIAAAPPQTFDPTPEIARIKAAVDAISGLDTSVASADPGAPAASTPPAADTGAQNPPADTSAPAGSSDTGATTGTSGSGSTDTPAS